MSIAANTTFPLRQAMTSDERVLVLMPTIRDGERTSAALSSSNIACHVCKDFGELCREITDGAGAAILSEEEIVGQQQERLAAVLELQPPWSDFPLLVLARQGGANQEPAFCRSMNVSLVERPVRIRSLLSVVQAALRSRRHQYALRGHLLARERYVEALRENDEEQRFVLAAGRLGSWKFHPQQRIFECSGIFKANFGRSAQSDLTYQDLLEAIHPEDRERVRGCLERPNCERTECDAEFRNHWPDGTLHWTLMRGRTAGESDDGPISGVSLDVTLLKQAELELRDADRRKDEFLALLAHELRNPLAPLRNGLQVMRLSGGEPEAVASATAIMERQLGHMVRLIDDLLDISRISQSKMELRRERVKLTDIVAAAVETSRPLIETAGHDLSIELPEQPVYLEADLTRLAQVFSNLLSNSAKYTTGRGQIRLSAAVTHGEVAVSVHDNGIGIPGESLASIFDMFSQVDRSIERSTGGLGIGLALVKGIIEKHGGTVSAASPGPGFGSTFTVRLSTIDSGGRSAGAAGGNRPARARKKVLVVDDNRDSAETMAMMLRLFGDEVTTAHDGIEAIEGAEKFLPDVILMDLGMPRLNGYDATRQIREKPWGKNIVIVALTGWGQEEDQLRSKESGCNRHLVKPVSPADLNRVLAES